MKSIRFRFLVAALAVLLGAAIAKSQTADSAAPPPMRGHEFGLDGHMMAFFAKYLDVTDAQKTQMKAVMQKEHAAMKTADAAASPYGSAAEAICGRHLR
jgi:Spy/CpxP family protein refolding chaperone